MKKLAMPLVLVLALMVGLSADVLAQTDMLTETQTTTGQQTETENPKQALKDRIDERKAALQDGLDERRESLILRKCQTAQQKLSSLASRVKAVQTKRNRAYTGIGEKFAGFSQRLANADVDTTELNTSLQQYQNQVTELDLAFGEYILSLEDMAAMNCTDDPAGFQATLQTARQEVQRLKTDITQLHNYVRQELVQAFRNAVNEFNSSTSEEE